jgi:hypothetical protein
VEVLMLTPVQTWMFLLSMLALAATSYALTSGHLDRFTSRIGTGTRPRLWIDEHYMLVTPPRGQASCRDCGYFSPVDDLNREGVCLDCLIESTPCAECGQYGDECPHGHYQEWVALMHQIEDEERER